MLTYINLISGLLPIVFFCLFFARNRQKGLWVIFLYVVTSALTDNINFFFKEKISDANYYYSLSFFTVVEYTSFSVYFFLHFKSKIFRSVLIAFSSAFLLIAIYNIVFDITHRFDSLPFSIESILIICYSIAYFYEQLRDPETSFIYSTKTFWVIISILLYLSTAFIFFIAIAYMTEKEKHEYWIINYLANINKNILLSIAFVLRPSTTTLKRHYSI